MSYPSFETQHIRLAILQLLEQDADYSHNEHKEALAYFRAKGWQIGFDHREVWTAEHTAVFIWPRQ